MPGEAFYWILNMSVTASLAGAVLLELRKIVKENKETSQTADFPFVGNPFSADVDARQHRKQVWADGIPRACGGQDRYRI